MRVGFHHPGKLQDGQVIASVLGMPQGLVKGLYILAFPFQLARVVESNPHFVKAHLLLALLYMAREDFNKAGRCLYKILQIDKSNQKALYYMSIVKQNTGRADAEKRKMVKAFSHRKMEDDDVIIPNTYKENTGISTVLHIIIGLVLGIMAFYFLILPARTRDLNSIHDNNLKSYMQKLNNANQQYDILKADYDELDAHTKESMARSRKW